MLASATSSSSSGARAAPLAQPLREDERVVAEAQQRLDGVVARRCRSQVLATPSGTS